MSDYEKSSPLWYYCWSEIDKEDKPDIEGIRTLKILTSLGYNDAYKALKQKLGDNDVIKVYDNYVEEESISTTETGEETKEESGTTPDLPNLPDSSPLVFDFQVDDEGVTKVEYVAPSQAALEGLMRSPSVSSEEQGTDSLTEETDYFAFSYGGYEAENTEGWDRLGLLPDPWAEARYPTVPMIRSEHLKPAEIDPDLNMLTIASGLSNFALTPDKQGYGYTKLQLSSRGLRKVDKLRYYPYLQYVDLSKNRIKDPSPLWDIKHLVVLDLSRNDLTDSSITKPQQIWFLTYINMSYNRFATIPDFSNCWAIKHLNLSHNRISFIDVVSNLKYLSYFNLSYNNLEVVENLPNKLLREINFSHNRINDWRNPGPKAIRNLQTAILSHNQLPTLSIFADMYNLTTLDVSYNKISAMSEFDALKTLPVVTNLKIAGNELNKIIPNPKRLIVYLVPTIKTLDGAEVSVMERVSAITMFSNNPIQRMIYQDSSDFFYKTSRSTTVNWEQLKETGDHPALVILIGDIGSCRKAVINDVQRMNPYICKEVKMLTTRPRAKDEITNSRMQYVTIKKFNRIEKKCGFLVVERRFGHKYGIAVSELEDKNRVLLALMGMTGALQIRYKGYNPTLVVMLPTDEDVLTERCLMWFQTTNVYRTKFKVKSRRKATSISSKYQVNNGTLNDENNDTPNGEKSDYRERKYLKKRNSYGTICWLYNKYQKWKVRRYSEEIGEIRKALDETYGRLFTGTPSCMLKRSWCSIPSLGHVSFAETPEEGGKTSHRRPSVSEELELRRFIQNVSQNQMSYREMHIRNPGFFQLFINSDDLQKAKLTLLKLVEDLYKKLKAYKQIKTAYMEDDPYYDSMVRQPIMEMIKEGTVHDLPLDPIL